MVKIPIPTFRKNNRIAPWRPVLSLWHVLACFVGVCVVNACAYTGSSALAFARGQPQSIAGAFCLSLHAVIWPNEALANHWQFYGDNFVAFFTIAAAETAFATLLLAVVRTSHGKDYK